MWKISENSIKKLNSQIAECKQKLENKDFLHKAPLKIIEKEKEKLKDFLNTYEYTRGLLFLRLIEKYGSHEKVQWAIEWYRELCCDWIEEYSSEWFEYIYNSEYDVSELFNLLQKKKNDRKG